MATHNLNTAGLALTLSIFCLPAQGQIDPFKVKLFPKGAPAPAVQNEFLQQMKPRAQPTHPPRLSNSEYTQLRTHLATLLNVSPASLANLPVNATNLSTPGNVVHLQIGSQVPAGFLWNGRHLDAYPHAYWSSNGNSGTTEISTVTFSATNAPQGTYLLTVYMQDGGVGPKLSSVNCRIWYGNPCGSVTLPMLVPVQNGKVLVPFVQPSAGCLNITVEMPWTAATQPLSGSITACDFMRIL